jgi:excisionase family DNA binding protein
MESMVPERLLFTVPEAAAMLGIGKSKMWELVSTGAVRSVLVHGRSRRISAQALTELVERLYEDAG